MEENQVVAENVTEKDSKTASATDTKTQTTDSEVKEAVRKIKLKVNGAEKEYDEKAVIAFAQKGMSADEKYQKAAAERKKIEKLVELAETDPDQLLRELLKKDPDEFYKERIKKKLEDLSLDPKDRELRDAKRKIEELTKAEEARKEKEKAESLQKMTDFYIQKFDKEIPDALKSIGVPVNRETTKRMTDMMLSNLEEGTDLPVEVCAELVKDEYLGSVKGSVKSFDPELLAELLEDEVFQKVLEAKNKKKPEKKQALADGSQVKKDSKNFSTREEFEAYIKEWSKQ